MQSQLGTKFELTPASKFLFLDLDGVLQTPVLEGWREMEHEKGLKELLAANSQLFVVISSSHRQGRTLEEIRGLFCPEIAGRIVGATPVSALGRANGGRQQEIKTWLSQNCPDALWAAVDDEPHLFSPTCQRLVVTHRYVGWDEATTMALQGLLGLALHHPTKAGIHAAPIDESAIQRWRPSTNSSLPLRILSTGKRGQSLESGPSHPICNSLTRANRLRSGQNSPSIIAKFVSAFDRMYRN